MKEAKGETPNQIIMDAGDFVPEEYTIRFSVGGREYEVAYGEAKVDEVLPMLIEATQAETLEEQMQKRRAAVESFFSRHLTKGDPEQLYKDLDSVPYSSSRESLDILGLYLQIQQRHKKKDLGEKK